MRHDECGLYWAAGFLEGEGSFICNKRDGTLRIDASQKDREPLERLQGILGGGIYWGGKQGIWRWRTTGGRANVRRLMQLLRPQMSARRRGQIDQALAKQDAYAGSDEQRQYNAKRAEYARSRYRSDPEYRARRLEDNRKYSRRKRVA